MARSPDRPGIKPLPTLDDVARLAGVSASTVSRALNTPHRVRADTRDAVMAAVTSLGYAPDFSARALVSRRTDTVGAVVPTINNAIFARALQAMEETLSAAGVTLLIATSQYDAAREAAQVRALLGRGVDALVLVGEARDPVVHALIERRGLPLVLIWSHRDGCPWPSVGFDNRAAAWAMAKRVLDRGHRRIAMIAGITRDNDRAAARVEGVCEALAARGMTLADGALVECPYTPEAGAEAARRLIARRPRPTAILCGNDVLAAGASVALREAGLAIPGDVSLTGFDDIDIAALIEPPLTTVRVPQAEMGEAAARLVLGLRDGSAPGGSLCLDTRIVERASLGPPA